MTTFQKYNNANNARGQLKVGIGASSLSFVLDTGQGDLFPANNGTTDEKYLLTVVHYDPTDLLSNIRTVLKREIVLCSSKASDTFTIVRSSGSCPGSDTDTTQGTTAYAFDAGDYVYLNETSELTKDMQDELTRLEADKLDTADYQLGTPAWGASSGGTDAYAITPTPAISAYTLGMVFRFQADVGNTGACTLNVNAKGALAIKKLHDQDLETGDIEAGQIVEVCYDGTLFQMNSQIAQIPNIDIHTMSEKTGPLNTTDELPIWDDDDDSNKKITMQTFLDTIKPYIAKFGGDGSDGILDGSAGITLTGSNNTTIVKNYTEIVAGSAPRILDIGTLSGCLFIIKVQGDCDLTNWKIDGSGGAPGNDTGPARSGRNNFLQVSAPTEGAYYPSQSLASGGGGGGYLTAGSNNQAGGGLGSAPNGTEKNIDYIVVKRCYLGTGGATGGGTGPSNTHSVSGGGGGAIIIFEVGGNLILDAGSTVIDVSGHDGSTYSTAGSGGGGGGCFVALYNGTLTGSCTPDVSGGTKGNASAGDGGAGDYAFLKNTSFA